MDRGAMSIGPQSGNGVHLNGGRENVADDVAKAQQFHCDR